MIISIRGTSGAGKSTLARAIFMQYTRHRARFKDGRLKPYYTLHGKGEVWDSRNLVVPGHYEIGNGGMDTLGTLDEAYEIARWADNMRFDCLMEGKCMSDGATRILDLAAEKRDVRVVHIETPIAECVASVRARGHNIAETSIEKTDRKVRANMQELRQCKMKLEIFSGSRQECLETVERWLGLSSSG